MKTQTFNISMPSGLVKQLDNQAKQELTSRSELTRKAIARYLNSQSNWDKIFAYGEKQAKKLGIKEKDIDRLVSEYRHGK
ncbi:ribbon-helix-helix protein, CopG family [Candidatus Berkelbacteria bacterium]|uniref:Ribbon-helix-helix protein CopG domain-containing protein n=1 Tax=Candidatus Berkelbacteria bacterium CG10_big_fil_rev_8_21_14_0_10_43_14 TaxID=1974515 RepID=A0A2M6R7X0_9BACT|nr:ribbon-helix-helix protein, CopG family [Candidatus Berkelbacteria bacterium]OIP07021.1 MAG: hypothetical protein AUK41_00840 [Candidatus Berkelbacteria bacterium CG2_30_43_20]PIS06649.1 MAG: hypothetical protein COT79_03540 [Candidatus Berkelbacteria bacterium CG10_big_fil_rev_8_21_14_0_10_43_14]PIU86955.1 MAG: hypothetical protein COS66_03410 [Candidatus Berkelbacteria bacterium CG06_land_8_20_14_3_00_43_10]